ncbi:Rv2578c family radical SAM protein [Kineococcus rubinsiae]|uniref:Rv2578c family radical SAM protein n=1 Tax=Kineococcus rubinsiae TaxID=2609562 RepID=UPI0014313156|nr:Rv2578c family radical SAM protein [Kineococcus rubinsiae]NIZ89827.1 radical SAM protein [Kineococcus rubinsiae]
MRWSGQELDAEQAAGGALALPGMAKVRGFLRTVTTPEFAGIRFHEVTARTVLNPVPAGSAMPFRHTVNPYRGCSHACVYCYARGTHSWLELDTGVGFDREVVVKVNAGEALRRDLARPSWAREHVALGTNTDPYQRAEGRYRLMPGIIEALTEARTPFSILTKGTLLRRDVALLQAAAERVPIGLGVSLAIYDDALQESLEPGTPGVAARLAMVRHLRASGLPCGVMLAPVLPWLTDSVAALDDALAQLADAGATGVTVLPLHLRPGAKEWFQQWLQRERPDLVRGYAQLYGRGSYVGQEYRRFLADRVAPLLRRHGFAPGSAGVQVRGMPGDPDGEFPAGSMPEGTGAPVVAEPRDEQPALF